MRYMIIVMVIIFCSCKKEWLDKRSDKKQVVPSRLADYQALLDDDYKLNDGQFRLQETAEQGTDNYYLSRSAWEYMSIYLSSQSYIFATDTWRGQSNVLVWNAPYQRVFVANVILEGLENIPENEKNTSRFNDIRGQALFLRAHSFFWLAQLFAMPYHAATAATDLGIPVRTSSDANIISARATMEETYTQIINDLSAAAELLPPHGLTPLRGSRAAALGLLARTYLCMQDYANAFDATEAALTDANGLLDFNTLDPTAFFPIPPSNTEVIFQDNNPTATFFPGYAQVDSLLYNSYNENDLRRKLFFREYAGIIGFFGNYSGDPRIFGGLTTSELYLMKAECLARTGDYILGMETLNTLLRNRFTTGLFVDLAADNAQDALQIILDERRKETCFRGLRWIDIRRLSDDPAFAVTVVHGLGDEKFTLEPGSKKYAYLIPQDVIEFTGMPQNSR